MSVEIMEPPRKKRKIAEKEKPKAVKVQTSADGHSLPWCWVNELRISINGWNVEANDIHNYNTATVSGNFLFGGTTFLAFNEKTRKAFTTPFNYKQSFKPSSGGAAGHSERSFWSKLVGDLSADMDSYFSDSNNGGEKLIALVVEIAQSNTPCSGPCGCGVFIDGATKDLYRTLLKDHRVSAANFRLVVRCSATGVYGSQVVKTYPPLAKDLTGTTLSEITAPLHITEKVAVVHKYPPNPFM